MLAEAVVAMELLVVGPGIDPMPHAGPAAPEYAGNCHEDTLMILDTYTCMDMGYACLTTCGIVP
eukprot:1483358-Pleurochrysis_carterae.AAC.1